MICILFVRDDRARSLSYECTPWVMGGRVMQQAFRFWLVTLSAVLLSSTNAFAGKVVVPPLVPRSVPAQTTANMTTLIASELEFTGEFDTVVQLSTRPSQLGPNCLGSTPCLSGIAKANGSTTLLAGKVTKYGSEFEVVLTYLANGKIVRTVKRRMVTDPASVADELAVLVRHALTGVDPAAKAEEDKVSGFEGGGLALMDDEDEEDDDDLLMAAPAVGSTGSAMGSADDDFDDLSEDPEEDGIGGGMIAGGVVATGAAAGTAAARSRGSARAAAPSRAPTRAPARQPTPEPEEAFNPDDFSFGGSAEDISFGSAASMIEVDEPEDPMDFDDPEPVYADDLDEVEPRNSSRTPTRARDTQRDRSSRSQSVSRSPQGSSAGAIGVTGRLGYGRFQYLNFITYGVEASFQVQEVLAVVAGFDAHSTRRLLPPEEVPVGELAVTWNTLIPISAGLLYRPSNKDIRPYAGAGTSIIPGYVVDASAVAFGFHARGGLDILLTDSFGINVNTNMGFWAGTEWYKIQDLKNTGFVVQTNLGTMMVF